MCLLLHRVFGRQVCVHATESLSRLGVYLRSRGVESTFRLKHHLRRHPDKFGLEER